MRSMKKQKENKPNGKQNPKAERDIELATHMVFRVGISPDSVNDTRKIEQITKLVTAACELGAADYSDLTLDVSMVSCTSKPIPLTLVRGKTNG